MFCIIAILSLFPIVQSVYIGKMENNTMVATINTTLVNVTLEQCTCALLLTLNQSLIVALNYFHMNQTCQLFSYNSTSIWITSNFPIRGTFAQHTAYSTGAYSAPNSLVAVDFNNDGYADLAVVLNYKNQLDLRFGIGESVFSSPLIFSIGSPGSPFGLITGDFNGDNRLDFIVLNSYFTRVVILIQACA
ncbi:unnamed protein product [Adineta ricciae]|uniref:Uncharacterized protein n=1 Tax=Adineta ricciae TaxID=249248 RepID=A0A815G3F6_ADIRI|nr:unnamed protein product [Adineta ricciae]